MSKRPRRPRWLIIKTALGDDYFVARELIEGVDDFSGENVVDIGGGLLCKTVPVLEMPR